MGGSLDQGQVLRYGKNDGRTKVEWVEGEISESRLTQEIQELF